MLKEFKEFAFKGNMLDLAVGVIIGGAFGKVVTSIVNDLVMPPIGLLLGQVNFTDLFIALNGETYASLDAAKKAGAPTFNYGQFISTFLDFLIVSFVIFMVVKQLHRMRKKEEPKEKAPATTKECPHCLSDIPARATRCKFCTSELEKGGGSVRGSIQ
ncbi:large conductance mechanosensitive channel protein MscL [Paenibacillus athensensis]|uniref:Large-conductance mechanosensitive channel n=1 Tax=Paenibacillus athensensis TaxID=1967502 RepID=A0A4Y8PZ69_9BACL|nr:large conductance mechanosensitive channel protein MscL [Paenibacillus athensensis]MCD1261466.1 large conductance mechanosensitive channel protein MscL [Paenibacillus athensensis]